MRVLLRCTRGIDRHDVELVMSAFHPDALDTHGTFEGGPRDVAEWANEQHGLRWDRHMHYVTNTTVDIDGDVAHTDTYYFIVLRRQDGSGRSSWAGGTSIASSGARATGASRGAWSPRSGSATGMRDARPCRACSASTRRRPGTARTSPTGVRSPDASMQARTDDDFQQSTATTS